MRRPQGSKVGALPVMAGLVLASAFLRLGDSSPLHRIAGDMKAHAATDPAVGDDEVETLLTALQTRQAKLEEREAELDTQAANLDRAKEELAAQLAAIENAEAELRDLLDLANSAAQDDLARLATVYENMKPAEAGPLFEAMPPGFAAGFLGLMDPAASAAILARLPPESAYAVSVMLAGRHADLPVHIPASASRNPSE